MIASTRLHLFFAGVILAGLLVSSVVRGEGLDEWQARRAPRLRVGASPYPNFLLHILPTGFDPGNHSYRPALVATLGFEPSSETGRGHFYTRRAGFLDLAHIRRSIDFTAYVHHRVREGLRNGDSHFSFESIDRTTYHAYFTYPHFWAKLDETERGRLIRELSIVSAYQASIDFSNWREIRTWYGFHNVPGMPEDGSAFSYEDIPSHSVGAAVAVRALRIPKVPFDEAAEGELKRELAELGVVPRDVYLRAMSMVKDRWWSEKTCLKRNLDTGIDDHWVDPWLVSGLEKGAPPQAKRYPAPRRDFSHVGGFDCRGMVVFECEPHRRWMGRLQEVFGADVTRVRPGSDYPAILEKIRSEMLRELGPHSTVPYP